MNKDIIYGITAGLTFVVVVFLEMLIIILAGLDEKSLISRGMCFIGAIYVTKLVLKYVKRKRESGNKQIDHEESSNHSE